MKLESGKQIFRFLTNVFQYVSQFGAFGLAIVEYVFHKIDQIVWLCQVLITKNFQLVTGLKFQAAARLIWSRGRLGGRIKYIFLSLFTWTIFLAGGVFQSSFIEKEEKSTFEFLGTNTRSILYEEATAATYTGETALLDSPIEHIVEEGESLTSIGKRYGITTGSIKFANNLTSDYVRKGQKLIIPPVEGTVHKVKKGDTIEKLAKKYNVPSQIIVDFNYIDEPYELVVGTSITIPHAELPAARKFYAGSNVYDVSAYGVIPYASRNISGSGLFVWPLSGVITQAFSVYHPAIDIANNSGDIVSSDKGVVVRAGWWKGGYGNAVQVDHGNGYVSTYAHMSSIAVSVGEEVKKGQKLGVVGSTGRSTGPHVHFTIQYKGKYLNPLSVL